jgi:predicted aldo/keto reductase-like oxidoreductase
MEPVKGGTLVKLPPLAEEVVRELGCGSAAELAIRYAAGAEGVFMTLSGMGNMDMMLENIGFMKDFKPLSEREHQAIEKIKAILADKELIACTGCRYCVEGCPAGIQIPDVISCYNSKKMYPNDWNPRFYYSLKTKNGGKASSCIGCGACEDICPQHLPVREILKTVAEVFEKNDEDED